MTLGLVALWSRWKLCFFLRCGMRGLSLGERDLRGGAGFL